MARKTSVAPAPAITPSVTSRTTRKAQGDTARMQAIVISDDEGSDSIEHLPLGVQPELAPHSKKAVKGASVRVKDEGLLDDMVTVLGGISLNGQDGLKVKMEPMGVSTPAKISKNKLAGGLIDLSYISPFPTPTRARLSHIQAVTQTPLFLPVDSDPESDWVPTTKKGRATRRVIRDPDSDSDAASKRSSSSRRASPVTSTSRPSFQGPRSRAGPSNQPALKKFFDLEARAGRSRFDSESEEDEQEREEKEKAWRIKYYDESLGSLKDFIVDDDYVSEEGDEVESEAESEESSEEEVQRTRTTSSGRSGKKLVKGIMKAERIPPEQATKPAVIEILDSDSDDSVVHSDPESLDKLSEDDNQDIDALLHFSPPPAQLHALPDLATLTLHSIDPDSEPETFPMPAHPSARRPPPTPKTPSSKKKWAMDRTRIAQQIFDELDRKVFNSKLGESGAGTTLQWNNRLLTTAGQAHSKRTKKSDGSKTEQVKIILSEKVLTGEEQILSTVAHEMCHVASWVISDERKNPHGKVFQTWGRKVMRVRPDIEVTTKHDYQIEYKFQWRCTGAKCDKIYKRHSKSIDVEKQACGRCRSKLEPMFQTKETSFQVYLKQNLSTAKSAMPGSSHGDVMRALSRQWTEAGHEADHQAHWSTMAAAARF